MKRCESLDVLRGLDMFMLVEGGVVYDLCAALGLWTLETWDHAAWFGCHFRDFIAPIFMFAAGASFPLSLAKSRERGMGDSQIVRKAFKRMVVLFLFGSLVSLQARPIIGHYTIFGTLQLIGMAMFVSSCLYVYTTRKTRLLLLVAAALGMAVFDRWVPWFGAPPGADPLSPQWNFIQGFHRFLYEPFIEIGHCGLRVDSCGPLCAIGASMCALLGMIGTEIVVGDGFEPSGWKSLKLVGCAAVTAVAAVVLNFIVPPCKGIWSPTYVMLTSSCAFVLLSAIYYLVDVRGWARWSYPFKIVGLNCITVYLLWKNIDISPLWKNTVGLLKPYMPVLYWKLLAGFSIDLIWLGLLHYMYKKKIFLKI